MTVVGIDLGTTNSVVATVQGGGVHVLADENGDRLIPSIVSFHPGGEVLVGRAAKARRRIDPKNTIFSIKRLIGHTFSSPTITEARSRFPFDLREGPGGGPIVHARGQDFTLPEISAFVLRRIRQVASLAVGVSVDKAVITVPAHFNELQRASTKVAGRVAGLEVMRILNEPTAAALAYGLGRTGRERVAVYDFGGGTFDCTILDLNGSVYEVLATAGDSFLGGDDVDQAIAWRMADEILAKHRFDARSDPQSYERLRASAEELKMLLSIHPEATVQIPEVAYGVGGRALDVTFSMNRAEFDALVAPLVDRTFTATQDALGVARLSPSSVDKVILVGGSTRIPLVRRRVEAFFGSRPLDDLNPDEVVAVGAAIQAAALTDATRKQDIPPPPPLLRASEPSPSTQQGPGGAPGFGPPSSITQSPTTAAQDFGTLSSPASAAGPSGAAPARASQMPSGNFGAIDEPPTMHSSTGVRLDAEAFTSQVKLPGDMPTQAAVAISHSSPFGAVDDDDIPSIVSSIAAGFGEIDSDNVPSLVSNVSVTASMMGAPQLPVPAPRGFGEIDEGPQNTINTMNLPPMRPAAPTAVGVAPPAGQRAIPPTMLSTQRSNQAPIAQGQGPLPPGATQRLPSQPPQAPAAPRAPSAAPPGRAPSIPPPLPAQAQSMQHAPTQAAAAYPQAPSQPLAPPGATQRLPQQPSAPPPLEISLGATFAPTTAPMPQAPTQAPPFPASKSTAPPLGGPQQHPGFPQQPPQGFAQQQGFAPPQQQQPQGYPPQPQGFGVPPGAAMLGQNPAVPANPYVSPQATSQLQPVLVDVTPRALVVETAGGFTDTLIPRNARIPCDRTRRFATGRDGQTSVRIRVGQGESPRFAENTYLGEVELAGLRAALRGEVLVEVTFVIDEGGLLQVRAKDATTGQEARATLQLVGIANDAQLQDMISKITSAPMSGIVKPD